MSSSDSSFSAPGCQRSGITSGGRTAAQARAGAKLTLLLGLLLDLLGGSGAASSSTSARGGSSTATRADSGEQVLHVLALESLQCNKSVPVSQPARPDSPRVRSQTRGVSSVLRTLANNEAQIRSTSTMLAALMRVEILSAWRGIHRQLSAAGSRLGRPRDSAPGAQGGLLLTVISTPSSARMSAA